MDGDQSIKQVSIAEQAKEAARKASETFEEQPNPWPLDWSEHAQWNAAYCRWNLAFSADEGIEASA